MIKKMESGILKSAWIMIAVVLLHMSGVYSYSCRFGCQRGQYCCKDNKCCDIIEGITPAVWAGISTATSVVFIIIIVCICVCVRHRRRAMNERFQQATLPVTVPASQSGVLYTTAAPGGKVSLPNTTGVGHQPVYTVQGGQSTSQQNMISYPNNSLPYVAHSNRKS